MATEKFQIVGAPTCRAVYTHGLFKKTLPKGAVDLPENYKYNGWILIPKDDEEKSKQVLAEYMKAFEDLRGKGFTKKTPDAINPKNNCLFDGDKLADEEENKEAFRGYWIVKVASKNYKPLVTDMQKRIILNGEPPMGIDVEKISPNELGSGDYVFASISFWAYYNQTFSGIGCNVHAIMRAKAGERIGGSSSNVDDYIDTGEYSVDEDESGDDVAF